MEPMAYRTPPTLGARLKYLRTLVKPEMKARRLDRLVRGRPNGSTYTSLVEADKRPHIGTELASKYAAFFGCSLDWLVRGEGRAPSVSAVQRAVARATSHVEAA